MGDNYLRMASENSMLGPIEGTSLSLFGTKINVADFIPPEADVDADAMSYSTFLAYAFGRRPRASLYPRSAAENPSRTTSARQTKPHSTVTALPESVAGLRLRKIA